jgi:hypothetical protein
MLSPNFAAQEAIVFLFAKRALRRASVYSVPAQRADAFFSFAKRALRRAS